MKKTKRTRATIRAFWESQDWKLQNCELADRIGCDLGLVGKWRRKLGHPKSENHHHPRFRKKSADWAGYRALDWTLRNVTLATQTGLTRERIRQVRRELGMPRAGRHYKKSEAQ